MTAFVTVETTLSIMCSVSLKYIRVVIEPEVLILVLVLSLVTLITAYRSVA